MVPLAHRAERRGRGQHHHVVRLAGHVPYGLGGAHRHRQHQPGRAVPAYGAQGRAGRAPGGEAVVHHDHRPGRRAGQRPVAPVGPHAAVQLGAFGRDGRGQVVLGQAEPPQQPAVEHRVAALGDRPDAELRLRRIADLARDQDVQPGPQPPRDLVADRDAAARQREDHRALQAERRQPLGERAARLGAVGERKPHGPGLPGIGASGSPGHRRHPLPGSRNSTFPSALPNFGRDLPDGNVPGQGRYGGPSGRCLRKPPGRGRDAFAPRCGRVFRRR
ncbi:hypothetical protein GEV43_30255 [Actinomadura sp. J1-007]|nr:hypothetical protein [Actinomadura sp. J1-007]